MSLTTHQKENTAIWQIIEDAIDDQKIDDVVTQVNYYCNSKRLIKLSEYPQYFNFALTGKAVIYAYILTYYRDSFDKTLVGRRMADTSGIFKWPNVIAQAVCAAIAEDCIRRGNQFTGQAIGGKAAINAGRFEGANQALYEDVCKLVEQFPTIERSYYEPDFNVSPTFASSIGGADVQLTFGPEMWSLHTTLKSMPLGADKLKQQVAYYLLDCDRTLNSLNGWKALVFYFPRHQQFIRLDPMEFVIKENAVALEKHLARLRPQARNLGACTPFALEFDWE